MYVHIYRHTHLVLHRAFMLELIERGGRWQLRLGSGASTCVRVPLWAVTMALDGVDTEAGMLKGYPERAVYV